MFRIILSGSYIEKDETEIYYKNQTGREETGEFPLPA